MRADTTALARAFYRITVIARRLSVPRGLALVAAEEAAPLGPALEKAGQALLATGAMADSLAEILAPHHVALIRFGEESDALVDTLDRVTDDLFHEKPRTPEADLSVVIALLASGIAHSKLMRGWDVGGRMPETTPLGRIVAFAGEAAEQPALRDAFLAAARKGTHFGESLAASGAGIPPSICALLSHAEETAPARLGAVADAIASALSRGWITFQAADATLARELLATFALLQAWLATGLPIEEAVAKLPPGRVALALGSAPSVFDSMTKHPDIFSHAAIEVLRVEETDGAEWSTLLGKLNDGLDAGAFLPASR